MKCSFKTLWKLSGSMFFLTGIHAFANKQISADKITEQLLYLSKQYLYKRYQRFLETTSNLK